MNYLIIKNRNCAKANFELHKNFSDEYFIGAIQWRWYYSNHETNDCKDLCDYLHDFFERIYNTKIDLFVTIWDEPNEEIEVRERKNDLYKEAIKDEALKFYGAMRKIINGVK